jgi:predicted O-methyltransferase YrrM
MNFTDPKVAAVYAEYQARDAIEQERWKTMPPGSGLADRDEFLLPVGPEVGAFLHASYGYSALFLADAARAIGATVITMELADYKQAHAREQLEKAGLSAYVDFRLGDAVELTKADPGPFDLVLLDIWKELYLPCFEALYPKLSEEGIIAADNMIYPEMARADVRKYRAAVHAKTDLQTTLLPIGSGIELSVKWSAENSKL